MASPKRLKAHELDFGDLGLHDRAHSIMTHWLPGLIFFMTFREWEWGFPTPVGLLGWVFRYGFLSKPWSWDGFVFFFWFTWESDLKCSLALFFLDFWLDPVGWADGARSWDILFDKGEVEGFFFPSAGLWSDIGWISVGVLLGQPWVGWFCLFFFPWV